MQGRTNRPARQGQQMADADFDSVGSGYTARDGARPKAQRFVRLAGGLTSLALVVGLAVWGYKLAVRDVRGVPVIQALEGPMRIAPEDPGGEIADHQGLAVNAVAAVGTAAPPPEKLILAPRPVDLAEEDIAGLSRMEPQVPELPSVAPPAADLALAAAPTVESASPTEVAVDAALAEALGEIPDEAAEPPVPLPDVVRDPVPPGAIAVSPRPRARPGSAGAATAAVPVAAVASGAVETPNEVDPATIPAGTRLVQFGAFETADEARVEWARLSGLFGELLGGKGMVLQPAESGGRTFYRLRVHGFEDEADARRFCSAFVAQDATCIPVPQR